MSEKNGSNLWMSSITMRMWSQLYRCCERWCGEHANQKRLWIKWTSPSKPNLCTTFTWLIWNRTTTSWSICDAQEISLRIAGKSVPNKNYPHSIHTCWIWCLNRCENYDKIARFRACLSVIWKTQRKISSRMNCWNIWWANMRLKPNRSCGPLRGASMARPLCTWSKNKRRKQSNRIEPSWNGHGTTTKKSGKSNRLHCLAKHIHWHFLRAHFSTWKFEITQSS